MTATDIEQQHFTWHCAVAALLIRLPPNAATKSNLRHGIRKATETAGGNKGVLYASSMARQLQASCGQEWHKCGLVKEHAIPVSEVCKKVMIELSRLRNDPEPVCTGFAAMLERGDLAEIRKDHRVKQIEHVVRKWTFLAWLTHTEHAELARRGLAKQMPSNWDGVNPFARYEHCEIACAEI